MCLQFGFVIFWRKDFATKVAHNMLMKLTLAYISRNRQGQREKRFYATDPKAAFCLRKQHRLLPGAGGQVPS
jgi:hypothetical protein